MKMRILSGVLFVGAWSLSVDADTIAYWRFEEGPVDTNVLRSGGGTGPAFASSVVDSSGNGNNLAVWSEGGGAGYVYRSDVPSATVAQTGAPNNFSVQNTGSFPAMYTETGGFLQTWSPTAFTFEAFIKMENNGGHRTFIGRDSQGVFSADNNAAAMYFKVNPDDSFGLLWHDADDVRHDIFSAPGIMPTWNFGTGSPNDIDWQHVAVTSDGATVRLYLNGVEVAAPLSLGAGNHALSTGYGDGGDWDAGVFSVGRGLYAGGHTDRAYGLIDEVRFSNVALSPAEFLMNTAAVPEPSSLALLGLGGFAVALLRRLRA